MFDMGEHDSEILSPGGRKIIPVDIGPAVLQERQLCAGVLDQFRIDLNDCHTFLVAEINYSAA
jgi:hypothetical protein